MPGVTLGFETARDKREGVQTGAGGVEDGVGDGGSYRHDRGFAGAGGGDVFAVEENGFDFGDVGEARDAIAGEAGVGDAAIFEFDGFEECAAESLNHGADDLIAEAVGIDDGATFEGFDQAHDADGAGSAIHGDFRAGGDVAAFFVSYGDAEALPFLRFLARPAEGFCRRLQDVAGARFLQDFSGEIRAGPCLRRGPARPCGTRGRSDWRWRPGRDTSRCAGSSGTE